MASSILKRKRAGSQEPTRKSSRRSGVGMGGEAIKKWNEDLEMDLRVLPPNVMRIVVDKLSVQEHMAFRAVCRYAHDEVESYWRSQRVISIPRLLTWFPSLHSSPWNVTSLSSLLPFLAIVFNLFKTGNLRKLSLKGVISVNVKSLVKCVEMATGNRAHEFFANVGELDLRGCFIPRGHWELLNELFLNLHTVLIEPNAIVVPKGRQYRKMQMEVSYHPNVSSAAIRTETMAKVASADAQVVAFIREHLPDVRHIYIDLQI